MKWYTPLCVLLFIGVSACTSATGTPVAPPTPAPTTTPNVEQHTLELLYWQAPTLLNPHLAQSSTDRAICRIFYEPLASFDKNGTLVPILAAEIPSLENGGVAADGKMVTWKLRPDIKWADGEPFTADDVVFTYEFITHPDYNAKTKGIYSAVEDVQALDETTVQVTFTGVTPAWYLPFVGRQGVILPRHAFAGYDPTQANTAPANVIPTGTGPYHVVEPGIKPQEVLLLGTQLVETNKIVLERNPYYRGEVGFDRIVVRGGGTVKEAARLLFETGEIDFTPNLQLLDTATLTEMAEQSSARGRMQVLYGPYVERILLNRTDPNQATEDGERSSVRFPHPFFSDLKVRQAFALAIDREAIAALYGPTGQPTANMLVEPPIYASETLTYEFNLSKAAQLLDEAGWRDHDGDGFRDKDDVKMRVVYQTSANPERQAAQRLVKDALNHLGIEVELKIISSDVFLSSAPDNPNTRYHFYADMEQYATGNLDPDPGPYMRWWTCDEITQKANQWAGRNIERWCNPDYDALYEESTTEVDLEKRRQLFVQMNNLLIEDVVLIPIGHRAQVFGVSATLSGVDLTPWDDESWNIQNWRRTQ